MMRDKKLRRMILCMVIAGIAVMFCSVSAVTGKACLFYNGFAVDGDGNLYIGKTQVIEVLKPNGDVLRRIDPCTSRGYRFTMDADQTLWIDTGGYLYRTDRFGTRIESREIHGDGLSVSVLYEYVSADGTAYRMKNRFLRPCIVRMEEQEDVVIYKMPVFDSAVRLLLIFGVPCFLAAVGLFAMETRKKKRP